MNVRIIEVVHADIFDLEQNLAAGRKPGIGQILDHFMLGIDGDPFSAGQLLEINAMAAPVEAQLNSVVDQAFTLHPLADPDLGEQVNRPCSNTPARTRSSTYCRLRFSTTTDSIPCRWSRWESTRPAGPAPTIPICVLEEIGTGGLRRRERTSQTRDYQKDDRRGGIAKL